MVERSLCMREARGSIPRISSFSLSLFFFRSLILRATSPISL
ncbi:hypothetical protein DCAR_0522347 [Daucus carota subsp. sativus]|uniref:Uncharacterized protein n=1 Tax=Daucus carota subsp. sativus TaxID=79200 RepID=A0AAF0X9H6_DAUCS|nr:hypothetical protein DCAR_0522347 [Daucus carota subsp. sativus]